VAEIGDLVGIATGLEGVAAVAASAGDAVPAARLFAAADAIRTNTEAPVPPDDRPDHEQSLALVRDRLDRTTFDRAWAAGENLTQEEAVAEALALAAELTKTPATT
jgi:hypothetical protein